MQAKLMSRQQKLSKINSKTVVFTAEGFWCHDTRFNDILYNGTQQKEPFEIDDTQYNDTQHNDTQSNYTLHNDSPYHNTQHDDILYNGTTLFLSATLKRYLNIILHFCNIKMINMNLYLSVFQQLNAFHLIYKVESGFVCLCVRNRNPHHWTNTHQIWHGGLTLQGPGHRLCFDPRGGPPGSGGP